MLSKIEEQGKRRLEVMDMISTNIYDMLKTLRKEKDQQFKVVCVCNICTILCLWFSAPLFLDFTVSHLHFSSGSLFSIPVFQPTSSLCISSLNSPSLVVTVILTTTSSLFPSFLFFLLLILPRNYFFSLFILTVTLFLPFFSASHSHVM